MFVKFNFKIKFVFKNHLFFRKSVILGEHNKATTIDCVDNECAPPTQTIDIESYLVHPDYNSTTKFHDIAIIRLKKDADISKGNFTLKKCNFTFYCKHYSR